MFLLACQLTPLKSQHLTTPGASISPRVLRVPSQLPRAPVQLCWPFFLRSSVYKGQVDSSYLLLGLLHIEKPAPPKAGLDFVVIPTRPHPK